MGCGGSKGTFDVVIGDTLVESEFNVIESQRTRDVSLRDEIIRDINSIKSSRDKIA